MMLRDLNRRGVLLVLLGTACFAAKGILIKLAYGLGTTATPLLMLRMLFALPFYLVIALYIGRQSAPLSSRDIFHIIGLGLLSYYISSLFDFWGLEYISAGLERLILYVYPTLVVLMNAYFKKRRISAQEKLALAIAYAGMLLVFVQDLRGNQSWPLIALGGSLVLVSTISFASFIVLAGEMIPRIGSLRFTAYGMIAACAGVILHNLITQGPSSWHQPAGVYWLALALAVFCTLIPSFLMNEGIRLVGSNTAAILGIFGPVVTLILGAIVLDEPLGVIQLAGAALVLGGVALCASKK